MKHILLLVPFFCLFLQFPALSCVVSKDKLLDAQIIIKKKINEENLADLDAITYLTQVAESGDDEFSAVAVCLLWSKGREDLVRKIWWQSLNRKTRMAAVGMILGQKVDAVVLDKEKILLLRYAERFNADEKKERIEEIVQSKKYISTFVKLMK